MVYLHSQVQIPILISIPFLQLESESDSMRDGKFYNVAIWFAV